jgi:hypothetical protein
MAGAPRFRGGNCLPALYTPEQIDGRSIDNVVASNCVDAVRANVGGVVPIGGGGASSTVITGWFKFGPYGARPLLDLLPALLHIRRDQDRTHLLQAALQLMAMETAQRGLGSGLVVSRLADIIFVQAVRAYIDTLDADTETGWLAALSDRRIGAALHLLHRDTASNWTVEAMAVAAGMSRCGSSKRSVSRRSNT